MSEKSYLKIARTSEHTQQFQRFRYHDSMSDSGDEEGKNFMGSGGSGKVPKRYAKNPNAGKQFSTANE